MNPLLPLILLVGGATAQVDHGQPPPEDVAQYVPAAQIADALSDPVQRCLRYPDLPGSHWPAGSAAARCALLKPVPFSLRDLAPLVKTRKGAKQLDARFRAELDAHYSVPAEREQIDTWFSLFDDSPDAERVARAWLAKSPDSPFARTALGRALSMQGWTARGEDFSNATPDSAFRAMHAHFAKALLQLGPAIKAEPKLITACEELAAIGRQVSPRLQRAAMVSCLAADPASYGVVLEMRDAAEPRWGGSMDALRKVDAYASARAKRNPLLYAFTVSEKGYVPLTSNDDVQVAVMLKPLARQVVQVNYMREMGRADVRMGDDWGGYVLLSQALRFKPDDTESARYRGRALLNLGYPRLALADAQRSAKCVCGCECNVAGSEFLLAQVVETLDGLDAAKPHYLRAAKDPDYRELVAKALARSAPAQR